MNSIPTFLFPVWQGAGDKAVYHGAMVMQQHAASAHVMPVGISLTDGLDRRNGIIGYDVIVRQLSEARQILAQQSCSKVLTLGGGCDAEILPISYLNRLYNGDLTVVWFDAHGDLNTPTSSPSGLFHGMPLRCLLDEGDAQIRNHCFSHLQPRQIVFAGCRDIDEPERLYICNNNIVCIAPQELKNGHSLCNALPEKVYRRVYIHIDLDVLDPECFPSVMCPVSGGISVETLIKTLCELHAEVEIVGIGIVEYVPGRDHCEKGLQRIISCCEDILAYESPS